MTKLVARKNLKQTAGHVRKLQSLCVLTVCLSRGLLTVCKVPHLNISIATLTLACVAASLLVSFFCVFERHPRVKSDEETRQVNKVNNGVGGKEKREKPPAFNSLRFLKRPFHS